MYKRDRPVGRSVRAIVGAVVLALSALALPGVTGVAHAAERPPNRLGPVQIQNVANGFAVDAENGDMAEGRKILQRSYKAEKRSQWWFEAAGSAYHIKSNVNGAYCVAAVGANVVLKSCGAEGTTWVFDEVDADTYLLKSTWTGKYLLAATEQGGDDNSEKQLGLGDLAQTASLGRWYLTDLALEEYTPPADPRLDEATFLTAHNAFNSTAYNPLSLFPNQSHTMSKQLDEGVRGLMLDVYEEQGALVLCHGPCWINGQIPLANALQEVKQHLQKDADAIVTLFLEDYVSDRAALRQAFVTAGLDGLIFDPEAQGVRTTGWPRLSEMRQEGKRLLVFTDGQAIPDIGVARGYDWTVENYWSIGATRNKWQCFSRWGDRPLTHQEPGFTPLFVMNQFRDAATTVTARADNGDDLADRALNICGPAARKKPNYVALDFYHLPEDGSSRQAIDTINRHHYSAKPSSQDLGTQNRRGPLPGLPNWTGAGYRSGAALPGSEKFNRNTSCRITPQRLAADFQVRPDDNLDDSVGLQQAIDHIRTQCSPTANFDRLSLIELPAGRIDITRQIAMDADYLVLRGQGGGTGGTRIVFAPDADTRYDTLTKDGGRWDQDAMTYESGADTAKGGWIWPGRGLFRVQTRDVAPRYADEWAAAPANRKDLYEGSVNQHWASGVKLRGAIGDSAYSAREGGQIVHLVSNADMTKFRVGGHLWVGAANSRKFYERQGATDTSQYEDLHMRQQVFRISVVDTVDRTLKLDKPLEFDLPVDSTSDGSSPIGSTPYVSKVTPLKMVVGVGFENFSFTQDVPGLTRQQADHNYGNLAPAAAMHGLVFKWAADSWARGVSSDMSGSHPVVTEVAKNLQFEKNHLDGAWNKGKGGNGYFRGSRVWDSLYANNTTRNLRHFTLQWSSSDNVVYGNDFDSDLNLHGGWERRNLFEKNTVRVPYEHAPGSCTTHCGGEGGGVETGTWYPIWWAAGAKAAKWAGSSGAQNVFHDNVLAKQLTPGGPYVEYGPYARSGTGPQPVFQFGSAADDPGRFLHLTRNGSPIADWNGNETADFSGAGGVNSTHTAPIASVFLNGTG
ncbi:MULTISPECIES: phosphatidylinositol-specific phospholipase C domain-containing protein [unclassified Streptomyces]|uniref:phosphatidylinositol-specific phospholipase C domain-containing protein n=1 Tax=unclassified Streptomyces TaxID=2593676 RepID=UPI0016605D8A|nr:MULTISPECIES: phosphatidylinositol-specific phospholipase C domain-containing protein [unclassified Streptomyces]MBD0710904.1 glycoside hydrolase [Streptomyces sp. CBMA291]MBD0717323.1 glycoside hydrolase [Streptomyces sp. CBMA370]